MLCLVCNVAFHVPISPALCLSIPGNTSLRLHSHYSLPPPWYLCILVSFPQPPSVFQPFPTPATSFTPYLQETNLQLPVPSLLHPRHAAALNAALYSFISKLIFHNVYVSQFLHLWVDTQADGTSCLLWQCYKQGNGKWRHFLVDHLSVLLWEPHCFTGWMYSYFQQQCTRALLLSALVNTVVIVILLRVHRSISLPIISLFKFSVCMLQFVDTCPQNLFGGFPIH